MSDNYFAVILAGGRGERFWPLSVAKEPKPFLRLVGGEPMLKAAVDRIRGLVPPERILIITTQECAAAARRICPDLPPSNIIGEPQGRDTAAAIALAGAIVRACHPRAVFCVLTADHVIGNVPLFQKIMAAALACAEKDKVLITLGIEPTEPRTGYGYVEAGEAVAEVHGVVFLQVRRFVEKPDAETAARYCASGRYYWNSGMFVWSADALYEALRRHRPALADMMDRLSENVGTPEFMSELQREYAGLERISIDYALMEKADNVLMVKAAFEWNDVGSWTEAAQFFDHDNAGNAVRGKAEFYEATNNIVYSEGRLTALLGVRDLIVVHAEGATLVCPRARAQDVKKLVERLRSLGKYRELL